MLKKIVNSTTKFLYTFMYNKAIKNFTTSHNREIMEMCKTAQIELSPCEGEEDFIEKWKPLSSRININSYRFYSQFIGTEPNILPDDLFHSIIEPLLNDKLTMPVYLNKNLYEKVIGPDLFPVCILRNMKGDYLTADYKDIYMTEALFDEIIISNRELIEEGKIIIKPTLDTGRGKGVRLFSYNNGRWESNDGYILSLSFLNNEYCADFIIQKYLEPSDFVKQFNPISASTFRVFVYRSVKDGQSHYIGGYLRVGDVGSFKDNIGSGGFAIPVLPNGTLAHFASNNTRNRYCVVNGINLKDNEFKVPNFDKVLALAFYGAEKQPHNRIFSFDILLDRHNNPHIIEFNLRCQTITTIQTTYKAFFGDFTDEVIDYCLKKIKNNQQRVFPLYLSNMGLSSNIPSAHS